METLKRLFLASATPSEEELRKVNTENANVLEYLCVRKTRLVGIIILLILEFIKNAGQIKTYETEISENILLSVMGTDILVILSLIISRYMWYDYTTFGWGCWAFIVNALKLFVLFVPYFQILYFRSDEMKSTQTLKDITFLFTVIVPWYLPFATIATIFKRNTYMLSNIIDTFNTWKVFEIIYTPFSIFIYAIITNIVAFLLFVHKLDPAIISVIYVLWFLGVLEVFAMYHRYNKTANVLYLLWVVVLLTTLNVVDDLLGWNLANTFIKFTVDVAINGIKLNWLCKEVLCWIYEIKLPNQPTVEMRSILIPSVNSEQ